jgi:hypothetical protein
MLDMPDNNIGLEPFFQKGRRCELIFAVPCPSARLEKNYMLKSGTVFKKRNPEIGMNPFSWE